MPKKSMDLHGLPVVKVSRRGANRLKDGHVWVYRSDIADANGIAPGSLVAVVDDRRKPLRSALYSSASQIAIRIIATEPVKDLTGLLRNRIGEAIDYHERLVRDTDAYRI